MPAPNDPAALARQRRRQKRTILAFAALLIVGGLVVLGFLRRMPVPLRALVGLTDIFTGLFLLVLVRQKFPR